MQSNAQLEKLASVLAEGITKKHSLPWVPHELEHVALTKILNLLLNDAANREVRQTDTPLSVDAESGLKLFLEKFLLRQIQTDNDGKIPPDVTFIFGHTHKPFEKATAYAGYTGEVKVFNDGGWVADSLTPAPLQGAAVVLVDEDLNTASVRLYNETSNETDPPRLPYVSEVIDNPLVQQLKSVISDAAPWDDLAGAVFAEIPRQRQNLREKIQESE
jgi:hypothetical protein